MKVHLNTCGAGPPGRWFFTAILLSVILLVLVQLCLPAPLKIRCLFFQWTGIPCPTCGATRCIQQILAGDFLSALRTQPLVFAAVLPGGFVLACCSFAELFRLPQVRLHFESRREKMLVSGCLAAAILLNWVYLIAVQ